MSGVNAMLETLLLFYFCGSGGFHRSAAGNSES
jgi:hypothetical protein